MSARAIIAEVGVGVGAAALLVGPAAARGEFAASPGAEVYGHAWVQGWAAAAWPALAAGTDTVEGAQRWPIVDPLPTWIVAGLHGPLGAIAAWNVLAAAGVVLAAAGGGALARALGGAGLVGAAGCALSPIFVGSLTSGLTEDVAFGLVPLAYAAGLRGQWRTFGALAGLSAWCGLYLGWMAGVGGAVIALYRWRTWREAWGGMLAGGILAAAMAGVAALPFRERLGGEGHRNRGEIASRPEPLWKLSPWHGADTAAFLAPGKVETRGFVVREHPVYAGFVVIGAAIAGGWGPGWLAVAASAAVAQGPSPTFAGAPTGEANPAVAVLRWVPGGGLFNHHARLWLPGHAILVALAARGIARRAKGQRWVAPAVAAAIAAEVAVASPARVPLPGADGGAPAWAAGLADVAAGPVLVLGAPNPQRPLYDQRFHGRVARNAPNRPPPAPREGDVVVAVGQAAVDEEARRGPPVVRAADGSAWVVDE